MQLGRGTRLGHYEIEHVLGAGGMGIVYQAFDSRLERPVAIKFIQQTDAPDPAYKLLAEARSASALNHPNICTVYEVAELGERHFIVMELVAGRRVSDILAEAVPPPHVSLDIALQVASALAHAHERGVVHGDLKAANVLVSDRGAVKVVDFGLARRQAGDDRTATSVIAGTRYAVAPEQVNGEPARPPADVWAFGVLLQELTCGTRPFSGPPAAVLAAILRDPPAALPPDLNPGLRAIIERCLIRDVARRFKDGRELLQAIERLSAATVPLERASRTTDDTRISLPPALAASQASRIVL